MKLTIPKRPESKSRVIRAEDCSVGSRKECSPIGIFFFLLLTVWILAANKGCANPKDVKLSETDVESSRQDSTLNIDQALKAAVTPSRGNGYVSSPFEVQMMYRLIPISKEYEFKETHRSNWKCLLENEAENLYGRMIAAHYLLPDDKAKAFLARQLKSTNIRHRLNAATVLLNDCYTRGNPEWTIVQLMNAVDTGRLDPRYDERVPNVGKLTPDGFVVTGYPDLDEGDITEVTLDHVVLAISAAKNPRAFKCIARSFAKYPSRDSAFAFGRLKDKRAVPLLIEKLEQCLAQTEPVRDFYLPTACIIELGDFEAVQAVGVLKRYLFEQDKSHPEIIDSLAKILKGKIKPILNKYKSVSSDPKGIAAAKRIDAVHYMPDPLISLIDLHKFEDDFVEKHKLLTAIGEFKDIRAIDYFDSLANSSNHVLDRQSAISGLINIGTQDAQMVLAGLLRIEFPALSPRADWSFENKTINGLKKLTGQDFGNSAEKWEQWIQANGN